MLFLLFLLTFRVFTLEYLKFCACTDKRSVSLICICVYSFIFYSQNSEAQYMENISQVCVVKQHVEVVAVHDVKEYVGMSS